MLSTEPTKRHSQRSMNNNSHSKRPRKKKVHPHIEYLQEQIDTLKNELSEIKQLETKQDELTQEEADLVKTKSTKEAHLEQTMTILDKLNESTMVNRSNSYYEVERKKKGEEQIISVLQFFYIVRLGQQGLFSVIADVAPLVDIDSLTSICDQLVGTSLYAIKDPIFSNRPKHKAKLFDLLHKLEMGVNEPVYEGTNTTFKQVKDLMDHIWENTKDEKTAMQQYAKLSNKKDNNESPVWIVMPYQSMMTDISNVDENNKKMVNNKTVKAEEDKHDDKSSDSMTNDQEKQPNEASAEKESVSSLSSTEEEDIKDTDELSTQEQKNISSDVTEHDADKQASAHSTLANSDSIQYGSESDNWRQRNPESDGTRHPRGRGRGGRGRGGSGRGYIRGGGRGGRGQGKRPRGAYNSKSGSNEEQITQNTNTTESSTT